MAAAAEPQTSSYFEMRERRITLMREARELSRARSSTLARHPSGIVQSTSLEFFSRSTRTTTVNSPGALMEASGLSESDVMTALVPSTDFPTGDAPRISVAQFKQNIIYFVNYPLEWTRWLAQLTETEVTELLCYEKRVLILSFISETCERRQNSMLYKDDTVRYALLDRSVLEGLLEEYRDFAAESRLCQYFEALLSSEKAESEIGKFELKTMSEERIVRIRRLLEIQCSKMTPLTAQSFQEVVSFMISLLGASIRFDSHPERKWEVLQMSLMDFSRLFDRPRDSLPLHDQMRACLALTLAGHSCLPPSSSNSCL